MVREKGKIIIAPGINVWPHELKTAEALAEAGHVVEFVRRSEEKRAKSADALIDGVLWEMKAPTADNLKAIERNLKRGRWQSGSIVFDCRRMKKVPGHAIEHEVRKQAFALQRIVHVKFIDKHGSVIDIR